MVLDEALDDYAILGLKGGETEEEIRKKYKKLALRWHPDKNINDRENSEKKFKSITEAYSNLIREKSNNKNFGYDEDIQNFFNEHFEFESIKREEIKNHVTSQWEPLARG